MSSDWQEVALEEVVGAVNTGLDAIKRAPIVQHDTGIKCLRIQDVSQSKSFHEWGNTEVRDQDFEKYRLKKNEIIMARTCSPGICLLVKTDMMAVFNNGLARLRANEERIDPRFLLYVFKSKEFSDYIYGISHGTSVQLNMKVGDLTKYRLQLPPLNIQHGISDLLETLDDRITQLRETNATLEAIAQALFKSLFVDFEPVRAKMEGRVPDGMDEATAALFPDSFEESELGLVPRGWSVGTVEDICQTITNGGTPSRSNKTYWEGGEIPWFKTGDFSDGFLLSPTERITQTALECSAAKLLPENAVLMAIYAAPTVGRLGVLTEPAAFNQACTGMVAHKNIGPWFLYWTLYFGRDWFNSRANGAAQQNISKAIVSGYKVVIPSDAALAAFNDVVAPIQNKIRANSEQAKELDDLRDTLLPRLISGKLRLPFDLK